MNINDYVEALEKSDQERFFAEDLEKAAKIVMRNGERFYASGKHAGKKVGSVRGKGKKSDPKKEARASKESELIKEARGFDDAKLKSYTRSAEALYKVKMQEARDNPDVHDDLHDAAATLNALYAVQAERSGGKAKRVRPGRATKQAKPKGSQYLNTFFKEKGLGSRTYEIQGEDGNTHFVESDHVIALITGADAPKYFGGEEGVKKIEDTIRKIDFANGDVHHFLEYLGGWIAGNDGSGSEEEAEPEAEETTEEAEPEQQEAEQSETQKMLSESGEYATQVSNLDRMGYGVDRVDADGKATITITDQSTEQAVYQVELKPSSVAENSFSFKVKRVDDAATTETGTLAVETLTTGFSGNKNFNTIVREEFSKIASKLGMEQRKKQREAEKPQSDPKLDELVNKISELTDANDHTQSRLAVAQDMGDEFLTDLYTKIDKIRTTEGVSDDISDAALELRDNAEAMLKERVQKHYGEEAGKRIWGAL